MDRTWSLMLVVVALGSTPLAAVAQKQASPKNAPPPLANDIRKTTYTYKKVGALEIQADVYRTSDDQVRPVVVYIHGGALMGGGRDPVSNWPSKLVPEGYTVVSIDYRLAPETKLPELIGDVEDAFRWVRERGPALYHVDPDRLAVLGGSAGGYLTLVSGYRIVPRPKALVALYGYGDLVGPWLSEPSPHPRHNQKKLTREEAEASFLGPPVSNAAQRKGNSGFYAYCRQQGIWPREISGWDPRTQLERFVPYLPLRNVTPEYPPTLLIHGDADTDVPYEQSVLMDAELQKQHVEHRLITIKGGEHGFAGGDPRAISEANQAVVQFIEQHVPAR
jgi:acetyl esterase/lipase